MYGTELISIGEQCIRIRIRIRIFKLENTNWKTQSTL